jgi:hypothetical protein
VPLILNHFHPSLFLLELLLMERFSRSALPLFAIFVFLFRFILILDFDSFILVHCSRACRSFRFFAVNSVSQCCSDFCVSVGITFSASSSLAHLNYDVLNESLPRHSHCVRRCDNVEIIRMHKGRIVCSKETNEIEIGRSIGDEWTIYKI